MYWPINCCYYKTCCVTQKLRYIWLNQNADDIHRHNNWVSSRIKNNMRLHSCDVSNITEMLTITVECTPLCLKLKVTDVCWFSKSCHRVLYSPHLLCLEWMGRSSLRDKRNNDQEYRVSSYWNIKLQKKLILKNIKIHISQTNLCFFLKIIRIITKLQPSLTSETFRGDTSIYFRAYHFRILPTTTSKGWEADKHCSATSHLQPSVAYIHLSHIDVVNLSMRDITAGA